MILKIFKPKIAIVFQQLLDFLAALKYSCKIVLLVKNNTLYKNGVYNKSHLKRVAVVLTMHHSWGVRMSGREIICHLYIPIMRRARAFDLTRAEK